MSFDLGAANKKIPSEFEPDKSSATIFSRDQPHTCAHLKQAAGRAIMSRDSDRPSCCSIQRAANEAAVRATEKHVHMYCWFHVGRRGGGGRETPIKYCSIEGGV